MADRRSRSPRCLLNLSRRNRQCPWLTAPLVETGYLALQLLTPLKRRKKIASHCGHKPCPPTVFHEMALLIGSIPPPPDQTVAHPTMDQEINLEIPCPRLLPLP